jgi:hypothetical protein
MRRAKNRWLAILVAVAGMGICIVALVGFMLTMLQNNLPWHQSQTARQYYQAVGDSYSQGFMVGFFLCFFMTMIAVTISTFFDKRAERDRPVIHQIIEANPRRSS